MTISIKCKDDTRIRIYEDASITYIDNGTIRFVNLTDLHGWTNSYRIDNIEMLKVEA